MALLTADALVDGSSVSLSTDLFMTLSRVLAMADSHPFASRFARFVQHPLAQLTFMGGLSFRPTDTAGLCHLRLLLLFLRTSSFSSGNLQVVVVEAAGCQSKSWTESRGADRVDGERTTESPWSR